jgi:hypothetical protein
MAKSKCPWWYVVVECDQDGKAIEGVSHWLFREYDSALKFKEETQKSNPEIVFMVLTLSQVEGAGKLERLMR